MLEGTIIKNEFLKLWDEYENKSSIEAKIVKDADNLDVDFELVEQAANGGSLKNALDPGRSIVAADKLYTKTAKAIYKQLQSSNPHDWHVHGRNRINAGDWKP